MACGGIFAQEGANTTVGGFTFQAGKAFDDSVFGQPQILAVDSVDNFTFSRSTVANFDSNRNLIEFYADADGGVVTESVFSGNRGRAGAGLIAFFNSGTSGSRMTVSNNTFEDNQITEGGWSFDGLVEPVGGGSCVSGPIFLTWASAIRALEGYTDIVNNVFRSNEVESLIQSVTATKTSSEELRILGNVIVNTTVRTDDLGFSSGPLIHGFHQPKIMAVNNTSRSRPSSKHRLTTRSLAVVMTIRSRRSRTAPAAAYRRGARSIRTARVGTFTTTCCWTTMVIRSCEMLIRPDRAAGASLGILSPTRGSSTTGTGTPARWGTAGLLPAIRRTTTSAPSIRILT
ncbi:MAG: hypothetical protein HND48_20295 [Chloroflexi bacterium]|nr:hypothetical protein [Chloroflexota bacterium]